MCRKELIYTDSIDLGRKLKEYRKSINLSPEEAAELIGISRGTLDKWESTTKNHNLAHAKALNTMALFQMAYGLDLIRDNGGVKKKELTSNEEEVVEEKVPEPTLTSIIFAELEEGVLGKDRKCTGLIIAKTMDGILGRVDQCWENLQKEAGSSWHDISRSGIAELMGVKVAKDQYLFVNMGTNEYIQYKVHEAKFGSDGTVMIKGA